MFVCTCNNIHVNAYTNIQYMKLEELYLCICMFMYI
jgi:hypothetical protein